MFNQIILGIDEFLWNNILLFLLIGCGVFFSIRTRFVQIRRFPKAMRRLFLGASLNGGHAEHGGMSSFQALATAVAAQVGTGNITGCATALVSGGPGAIFWMWVAAFLGMATIYGEAILAQKTRVIGEDGYITGGPVYYIREAFHGRLGRFLEIFFSVAIIIALGFMGNMVQTNSITDAFHTAFGVNKLIIGVIIAIIAAFIFLGGVERITSFTEKVVPIMAILYLIGGIICLIIFRKNVPSAFLSIFIGAFSPRALGGAVAGVTVRQAMRYGVARGLFCNEAGMGSTPHAHAMAHVNKPQDQGETAMVGVFIVTFIVLTMTALVILSSGVLHEMIEKGITGTAVAQAAFSHAFGSFGPAFVAICLLFFAFSTIISWYFFASSNVKSLLGKSFVKPFTVLSVISIVVGSTLKVDLVWNLSDLFNGLMVLPNLAALFALSGIVKKASEGKDI